MVSCLKKDKGDNYPYYNLVRHDGGKGCIILVLMHNEHNPDPICIFPPEQLELAEFLCGHLNKKHGYLQ